MAISTTSSKALSSKATSKRARRWDLPFGSEMTDADVQQLLTVSPFSMMDATQFPSFLPLQGILRNDTRIVNCQDGDIVIREGDYGNSAFLVLDGEVLVSLAKLPEEWLGRPARETKSWLQAAGQLWTNHRQSEVRTATAPTLGSAVGTRSDDTGVHVFLQDVPRQLDASHTATLTKGEIFGELAALSRTPCPVTVVSKGESRLLEIRWQGLRDLLRYDEAMHHHVHQLYRENSLQIHLRETPIFKHLDENAIRTIADATEFKNYGDFDWQNEFKTTAGKDVAKKIEAEPIIISEGNYADHLLLVRSGFARVSRKHADGHRTFAYLGKGQIFGLPEMVHNWTSDHTIGYQYSLRAIGYVDVLSIPTFVLRSFLESNIHDTLKRLQLDNVFSTVPEGIPTAEERESGLPEIETGLLEFLVERRLINGTKTMLIDLDRCTRCDDCVRACAAAHDNNPRFVRQGQRYRNYLFTEACMHCVDPVCMIGCPTGAITRRQGQPTVSINDLTCIGCSTCSNSCPYNAIQMVQTRNEKGSTLVDAESKMPILKATKCDLCSEQPTAPACQSNCSHDALVRIDMSDLQGLADWLNR